MLKLFYFLEALEGFVLCFYPNLFGTEGLVIVVVVVVAEKVHRSRIHKLSKSTLDLCL